jgi:hypothetical protein
LLSASAVEESRETGWEEFSTRRRLRKPRSRRARRPMPRPGLVEPSTHSAPSPPFEFGAC